MLFKLYNNAVYGKTMENKCKHVDVKLVNKWTGRYGAEALIAKPNFHSCTIFEENLVAAQMLRSKILIRKPIYVGLGNSFGLIQNSCISISLSIHEKSCQL